MKNINNILLNFGLSEAEIAIYIAILGLDKPTVTQISRKIDLDRTAIYFHLKNLIKKNIVQEIKKDKIKRFSPTPPKELADRFQNWTTDFTSLIPQLESMQTIDEETPIITVKDFKTSQYDHYNELASMPEGSEFRVVQSKKSADADLDAITKEQWQSITKKFVDRKIMTRAIFTDEMIDTLHEKMDKPTYELFKKRNWQLRSSPEENFEYEEMMIHQDKVTFLLTDVSIIVRIQHKRIAKALTSMFDALWLTGKPRNFS